MSTFDSVRWDVAVAGSAGADWTGVRSLDKWFLYCWETVEVFDWPDGHKMVSHKRPLDVSVHLARKALRSCAVHFAIGRLISMDEAHARISGSEGVLGLCSDARRGDSHDDELRPYLDDDNCNNWNFASCWLILTLTVVTVFANNSTPFLSYAVQRLLPYLKTLAASLAWRCRT